MAVATESKTHDYTNRYWGYDYSFEPIDGDQRGKVFGWGNGLQDGDFLLLQNGSSSTRYRIERVEYIGGQGGPKDQWKADVVFAPRPPTPEQFEDLKEALPKPRADYLPD